MKLYTKQGDKGETSLANGERVLKTDERIELLGSIDELCSFIGLAKPLCSDAFCKMLSERQKELMQMMAVIAEADGVVFDGQKASEALEREMDRLTEDACPWSGFVLYGANELSARLDVARSVARRAERCYCRTIRHFSQSDTSLQYLNRLSDYLYLLARKAEVMP